MRLLIVDDEPPALAKLRRLLQAMPEVSWLGEAGDAEQALALLQRERVDAVLLDIQMPGMSGLELALKLQQQWPAVQIAFCTAYDEHALRAFDLNAVDYLLKPYVPERLAQTVQRLAARLARPPPAQGTLLGALQQLQPVAAHWLVMRQGGLHKLPLAEIEWVAAADNYIELHAPPQSYLERRSLAAFLEHSAAAGFVRVHRCHAVNAAHIQAIAPLPYGEANLTLSSGQQLRVSRSYRARLK